MQVTDGVAEVIRVELARRRMSVEAFTAALTYPGTSRPVLSFRSMCRRLAEPGTFKLEELAAIADLPSRVPSWCRNETRSGVARSVESMRRTVVVMLLACSG